MNTNITINEATRELRDVKASPVIGQPTRDSAQWAELILSELRQQLNLNWDATMDEMYRAIGNLGNKGEQA